MFNLFRPIFTNNIIRSLIFIILANLGFFLALKKFSSPSIVLINPLFTRVFLTLVFINLFSLVVYRMPVTTLISFNFSIALSLWLGTFVALFLKIRRLAVLLPSNTPWYLMPFLCLVELISSLVRPLTLRFRLMANLSAGHILLRLITKVNFFWISGILLCILELIVCVIQGFVFVILLIVYLEESLRH